MVRNGMRWDAEELASRTLGAHWRFLGESPDNVYLNYMPASAQSSSKTTVSTLMNWLYIGQSAITAMQVEMCTLFASWDINFTTVLGRRNREAKAKLASRT